MAEALHTWQDLASSYQRLAEQLEQLPGDADRSAALWLRLGRIYKDRLPKKREALAAVQAAVRVMPDDVRAQDILVELLREQHRWQELAAELRAQANRAPDAERRQRLLWRRRRPRTARS
jgi:hypothetical protein